MFNVDFNHLYTTLIHFTVYINVYVETFLL